MNFEKSGEWLKESARSEKPVELADMSVDDLDQEDSLLDPQAGLWEDVSTFCPLPIPYQLKNGDVVRGVTLRPMPRSAEKLLQEEGGNRAERARRSVQFLSLLCESINGKRRTPETKDTADFFLEELLPMPIINETCILIASRMLSVHLPTSGVSGRKYVFERYCAEKGCVHHQKSFEASIRLDHLPMTTLPDEKAIPSVQKTEVGGCEFELRQLTLEDKAKIFKVREEIPKELADGMLWLSIVSLNGSTSPKFSEVRELSRAVKNVLFSRMESAGVRIRLSVECPSCGAPSSFTLPWEQRSFFSPSEGESDEKSHPTVVCRST